MARTRGFDNPRERELRSRLHRNGFRFRIHYRAIVGSTRTVDIAFTRLRLAVFSDGCFWHDCPQHGTQPKKNADWWRRKIAANVARDRDTDARLVALGWSVLRLWEHVPIDQAMTKILGRFEALAAERGRECDRRIG
jgi:DNA mismatch endonuclease, patch repair protein